jgi:Pyruvate/2-oxoacid:ferredoxin oxidoreductase gamma subunit
VKDAYIAAVCMDGTGKIVGGGQDYFTVKSGGSTAVQIRISGKGIKSCQLYPTLGGASWTG